LHEVELKVIFTTLDIYDQVALQRVCKHWKKIIRKNLLPKYLKQNYPLIYAKYDTHEEHSRMLLDMLPREQVELHFCRCGVTFQFFKRKTESDNQGDLLFETENENDEPHPFSFFVFDLDEHKILEQCCSYDSFVKVLVACKKYRKWRFRVLRLLKVEHENGVQFRSIQPVWGNQYFWIEFDGTIDEDFIIYTSSIGTYEGVEQDISRFYHDLTGRLF